MFRYVLYDGAGKFLRRDFNNQFVETDDIVYATQFHPIQKAERVLRNLPQDLASRHRIAKLAPPRLEDRTCIIPVLDEMKQNSPDQIIVVETPGKTISLRIGDALIYEDPHGWVVIDAE